ncbi:MAG: PhnD/SsuA/transferrin family substrate-binding protein, partial [Syntrophales bacterium]|nr:PhnD/SsuA/transferrin family substrate-binding protein [Syntrophales bacterium]
TTAGYLLPLAYFKKNDIIDYRTYLKEIYFTGTHEDAIYDVLNKKADIGAAKNTVFDRLAQSDDRIRKELSILFISPDVPENCLALKMTVDVMVRKKIKDVLLQMERDAEGAMVLKSFGAKRFIVTKDEDYAPVFKYASDIGLNLATYDYLNN